MDVRRKRRHLQELLTQHASLQNLAKLNKRRGLEAKNSKDLMDEDGGDAEANATVALPFIVVATPASTTVPVSVRSLTCFEVQLAARAKTAWTAMYSP